MVKKILILFIFPFMLCGQESNAVSSSSTIQIINENGLFGLQSEGGETMVAAKYKDIKESCNLFICETKDDQYHIINSLGIKIIEEELIHVRTLCHEHPVFVGTNANGVIHVYDHQGNSISPISFSSIPKLNNYKDGGYKLALTKMDGIVCLLQLIKEEGSPFLGKIIEKPKGHNSARIITYLPAEDGMFYKQLSLNNERFISEPIYQEICLERDCIQTYKDKTDIKAAKSIFVKAIGIKPDMSFDVYDGRGKLLNKKTK
ncbi:MAG: hypothetical protein P1U56_12705 [Saprospiraceae bacterium]|nr:hypothetical protein [Saprospiraceae bacterium]